MKIQIKILVALVLILLLGLCMDGYRRSRPRKIEPWTVSLLHQAVPDSAWTFPLSIQQQEQVISGLHNLLRESLNRKKTDEALTDEELWRRILAGEIINIQCGRISRLMGRTFAEYGILNRRITLGSIYFKTLPDGKIEDGWSGHVANEIWSPRFNKWYFMDYYKDCYFVDSNGIPQTAIELQSQYAQYGPDTDTWDIKMMGEFNADDLRDKRKYYGDLFRVVCFQLNEDYMNKKQGKSLNGVYHVNPPLSDAEKGVLKWWQGSSRYRAGKVEEDIQRFYDPPKQE